jgi:hypothetical protein
MVEYTPAPQCFGFGFVVFALFLTFALTLRCRVLLPTCPVTAIVPMGPIGTCRIEYTYEVASATYAGSMEIDERCVDDGAKHTVSVCYDDRRPSRHDVSVDAGTLSPGRRVAMLLCMSVGIAIMAFSACAAGEIWRRNRNVAAAQHRYVGVGAAGTSPMLAMLPLHGPPDAAGYGPPDAAGYGPPDAAGYGPPDAAGYGPPDAAEAPPLKGDMLRSDSAML